MSNRKISEIAGDVYEHLKVYLKNYFRYLGYDSAEMAVRVTSYILTNFIVIAVAGLFLNIFLLAFVFFLGYTYDAMSEALLFIAVFYLLLALIFIIFKNPLIKRPIQKQIIQYIFADREELEEKDNKK